MGRGRVRWTAGCGLPVGGVGAVAVVAGCGGPLGWLRLGGLPGCLPGVCCGGLVGWPGGGGLSGWLPGGLSGCRCGELVVGSGVAGRGGTILLSGWSVRGAVVLVRQVACRGRGPGGPGRVRPGQAGFGFCPGREPGPGSGSARGRGSRAGWSGGACLCRDQAGPGGDQAGPDSGSGSGSSRAGSRGWGWVRPGRVRVLPGGGGGGGGGGGVFVWFGLVALLWGGLLRGHLCWGRDCGPCVLVCVGTCVVIEPADRPTGVHDGSSCLSVCVGCSGAGSGG
ncbi:Hypothetical Protein sle_03490 [Streptomyces leeuwenhoekii]|uniref:Uncharacterized protein n=1 Tax=Streptomyces leeuwenhoekii TaxID=1437453 RepID=A0A0F7VSH5_STRLW|nr:Hypothetical Protein sle_03490 [Streptomyces leeuwenhoekii]